MRKQQRPPLRSARQTDNQLRIIGGQWRGRKLSFPDIDGLRPTPDRVRETLFNWLAAVIPGAHCLDLFAGSGALGLEALSRGAASVTLIDSARQAVDHLRDNLALLAAEGAEVIHQSANQWMQSERGQQYDVVFLDPPFGKGLASLSICGLDQSTLLSRDAWVYLETGCHEPPPLLPAHWQTYREKQAGQVRYRLFHVAAASLNDS